MYRVFNTVLGKSSRHLSSRGMSSETSEALKWEKQKLEIQLQHDLTLKHLELEKHLEITRNSAANSLKVGSVCVVIVASAAWLVSSTITETKANLVFLQREVSNHGKTVQSLMSGGRYVKPSPAGQADSGSEP